MNENFEGNIGSGEGENLLSPEEQQELNELRKDQINDNDWTEEKRLRLLELSKKEDDERQKRMNQ